MPISHTLYMILNNGQNSSSQIGSTGTGQPNKRNRRRYKMVRVTLSISDGLLGLVDEAAEKDFTTRSDMIRTALLWYLRPQGRDLDQTDPETILKTLNQRRLNAALKEMTKDMDMHLQG